MEERNFNNGGKFFKGNNNAQTRVNNPQPEIPTIDAVPVSSTPRTFCGVEVNAKNIGIGAACLVGATLVVGGVTYAYKKWFKKPKENNVVIPEEVKE